MHWVRRGCCWQWAFGGLGSGTMIQFYENWLKDKLFWLFPCFFSIALLSQHWEITSFFSHGHIAAPISEDSNNGCC